MLYNADQTRALQAANKLYSMAARKANLARLAYSMGADSTAIALMAQATQWLSLWTEQMEKAQPSQ